MIFRQWLITLRRFWLLAIVALVLLATGLRMFEDRLLNVTAPVCDEPPAFRPDVPEDLRAELQLLFDNELLYCEAPRDPFAGQDGPVYWGSEGTTSLLFFQAESLGGVGITTYGFGDARRLFNATTPGGAPPATYGELRVGSPVRRNQATTEDPTYFVLRGGPPLTTDVRVQADIRGPRLEQPARLGSRNAMRDAEALLDWVTRSDSGAGGSGTQRTSVHFSISSKRWDEIIVEEIQPELAPAVKDGSKMVALRTAREGGHIVGPTPYRVMRGPFAASVWVAGVVTETQPALALIGADGGELAPLEQAIFTSRATEVSLAMFTFESQAPGQSFEARYWGNSSRRRDQAAPDQTWTVTIP